MKKLLIGFLASFMALACFAGCGDNSKDNSSSADNTNSSVSGSEETSDDLATAKDYLKEFYREKDVATRANYTLLNEMMGCSIAWSVDVTEGVELVVGAENTQVKLTAGSEDIAYVLTATLTDANGNTATVSFNRTVLALEDGVISAPAENTVYYMSLYQGNTKKTLYLTGEMNDSGKFFGMTSDGSQAAAVYAEAVEDGYKFYVLADDNSKSYLTLTEYQKSNGYYGASVSYTADGTVLHYEDLGCWAATLEHDTYFLGTYGTYETASASTSYYMTEDKMGTEQFPLQLVADTVNDNPSTETPDDNSSSEDATNSSVSTPDDDSSSTTPDSSVSTPEDGNSSSSSSSSAPDDGGSTETPSLTPAAVVDALYALADGESLTGPYTVTGVITALDSWNNPTIVIENKTDKPVYCFKLKDDRFVVGATITITAGSMKNYQGTYEFMDCTLDNIVLPESDDSTDVNTPAADSTLTIEEALAYAKTFASEQYSENKYYVEGTIKSVYNTSYGNMWLKDENGNEICVYGTYNADGTVGYGEMETQPDAGDIVKVYGVIGNYNGTLQLKEAWIVEHTDVEQELDVSKLPVEGQAYYLKAANDDVYAQAISDKNTYFTVGSSVTSDTVIFYFEKVEGTENHYYIKTNGNQYVCSISGKNQVKLTDTPEAWIINGNMETIQSAVNTDYYLQYNANSGQERISQYKGTQQSIWFEAVEA